jgi:hypothetical protein
MPRHDRRHHHRNREGNTAVRNKTPDTAPVPFSADDGDGQITVGQWSEGVGIRIQTADGRTVTIRLGQITALDLADQIYYAADCDDDQIPLIGEPTGADR